MRHDQSRHLALGSYYAEDLREAQGQKNYLLVQNEKYFPPQKFIWLCMFIFRYIVRYLVFKRSGNWRFHSFRFEINLYGDRLTIYTIPSYSESLHGF